jgi:anti-sigma factor RsiW
MCNQEHLVGYLYDDLPAPERAAFEAHLAGCAACRREFGELRQMRQHLTSWAPPAPSLDFRVIRGGPQAAPPRRLAPKKLVPSVLTVIHRPSPVDGEKKLRRTEGGCGLGLFGRS